MCHRAGGLGVSYAGRNGHLDCCRQSDERGREGAGSAIPRPADCESDKMVPSKNTVDLDRRLPNSHLVLYPDAGHGGVFQFHQDFVKRALEFL
jgi:hypothetical protein